MDASSGNGNASQTIMVRPVEVGEIASILGAQNQSEKRIGHEARQTAAWWTCSSLLSFVTHLKYGVHQKKIITSSVAESMKVSNMG